MVGSVGSRSGHEIEWPRIPTLECAAQAPDSRFFPSGVILRGFVVTGTVTVNSYAQKLFLRVGRWSHVPPQRAQAHTKLEGGSAVAEDQRT